MIVKQDSVLSSAQYIYSSSEHVSIDMDNLPSATDKISSAITSERVPWRSHPLNPKSADKSAANWIFVCDLLNFSFWADDKHGPYTVTYNDVSYTGYWAFCAALNRAEAEGLPLHDFKVSQNLSFEEFRSIFRSNNSTELPLLNQRYIIFTAAAKKMSTKYDNCFTNILSEAENDAVRLINILLVEFPSFFDVSWYKVADLWACFDNQSYGKFKSVDFITIFADYRIPQLLNHLGVLVYSDGLVEKLRKGEEIPAGSEIECEISGMSIYAANLIKELINESHPELKLNAILLDFFLWDYVKKKEEDFSETPFHRARTIYY